MGVAPSITSVAPMKRCIATALMASLLPPAGCASPRWEAATYERFPLNRGRVERGSDLIMVIALVPGGGALAEAIGIELAKRGFAVLPSTSTMSMAAAMDLRAIAEHHVPARRNWGEMWKLRHALRAHGVDAFPIVRNHDFVPKRRQKSLSRMLRIGERPGFQPSLERGKWVPLEPIADSRQNL